MALQQAAAAAAISYAAEYIGGYNPTVLRSLVAGACGAADYLAKAKLAEGDQLLMTGDKKKDNSSIYGMIAGPVAGGALYSGLNYYIGGSMTSGFLRGALYAWGSDMLMQQLSSRFNIDRIGPTALSSLLIKQRKVEKELPPSLGKPSL